MVAYAGVAVLTVLVTLGLLLATKIPVLVVLIAATTVSGALMILGWLDLGYWDPFAPIAFVSLWFFAAVVSLALVGVGRWLKWPFFKPSQQRAGQSAL